MKRHMRSKVAVLGGMALFFMAIGVVSAQNLVKNGSFEKPAVTTLNGDPENVTTDKWNAYPSAAPYLKDLGWIVEWRSDVATMIIDYFGSLGLPLPKKYLELQESCFTPNACADTGQQWAELDSDWTGPFANLPPNPPYRDGVPGEHAEPVSISIFQRLNTLPGTYELSFAFGARPGLGNVAPDGTLQNKLEVRWDGQVLLFGGLPYVTAVDSGVNTPINWTKHTAIVQAVGTDTELRFTDLGYADSFGSFLDSVVVTPLGDGCTKTVGYWKTHSVYGPASRVDTTWNLLGPEGADTDFFQTNLSWYQILNTAPKGNAYFILAHQYIAAYLNLLSGSSAYKNVSYDDLVNAMATARLLLDRASTVVAKGERQQFVDIASFLTDYNEGLIGPGHCYDEAVQASSSRGMDK